MGREIDAFIREMNAESARLIDDINSALEQTTLYGWSLITAGTPVLTGRARASWLVTVDNVTDLTKPKVKSKGRVYEDPKPPVFSFDFLKNRHLYITNNVDYIEYLEYGTDKFAPFAMITRSVPKINVDLSKRFSRLNSKEY